MDWTNPFTNNLPDKNRQRRQRSAEHPRKPTQAAKSRGKAAPERHAPPVMVRGGMAGIPLQTRKSVTNKSRRRFDVALNIPGAEMRLPSMPQVAFGFRLISGLLVAVLAGLLYYLWNSPAYQVEDVRITGLQRITGVELKSVMDLEGEPVFAMNPAEMRETLTAAFPEFMSVSVKVSLPNDVYIEVVERQPILTWRQDGRTILVDASGISFPARDQAEPATALVVEASASPVMPAPALVDGEPAAEPSAQLAQFMPVEMVSAILSMSAQAPANTPLVYDGKHGLGWKDVHGWDVYFGDVHDIDTKLNLYNALVAKFEKEGIQPSLISVEHVHSPYYRLEE